MMMILASLMQAEAKEFESYFNDRAAAVLCTQFDQIGCSFIQDHVKADVESIEYQQVVEYIRLCPEQIADPLLDYAADTGCASLADCYEGCKMMYGDDKCAHKNLYHN